MKKSKPLGACFFASYTVLSVGPGWGAFSCRGTVCRRLLFGRASHMPIPVIILQIPVGDFPDDLAGVARGDGVGGHVLYDHAARADDGVGANAHAGADGHVAANPHVVLDDDLEAVHFPVGPQLVVDRVAGGAEHHVGADEHKLGLVGQGYRGQFVLPHKVEHEGIRQPHRGGEQALQNDGNSQGEKLPKEACVVRGFPLFHLP